MPDARPSRDDANDPRLAALTAWRQQLIDSGAVSARSFKEAHLRLVLRSGRSDVDQIRAMLPGAVAEHAAEMARVLSELGSVPTAGSTAAAPPTGEGRHRDAPAKTELAGDDEVEESTMFTAVGRGDPNPHPPRSSNETVPGANEFAGFTFGTQEIPLHGITMVRNRDAANDPGALRLSWPPHRPPADATDSVVFYRVISSEETKPYSPDRAHLVAVTTSTDADDNRPPGAAVRHFQVWCNAGETRAGALAAQPELHAEGVLVSPVLDRTIREDNGRVIGQWRVPRGVDTVHIYRVPADAPGGDGPQYRILANSDNLTGFIDTEAARGQRYTYRIRCAAAVDGVMRLSEAADVELEISAVLSAVTDLALTSSGSDTYDLSWTDPPHGRVVVYRSQSPTRAGAESAELPEAALDQIGLTPDLRLTQPVVQRADGGGVVRSVMAGVAWPANWSRSYLTPVTLLAGRALLGTPQSSVRTGTIREVELAEYCNKQVLTFDWPTGAAAVVVHLAPKGHDPRNGLTGKSFEISLEEYEKYGGMQLTGQLPVTGCSLHLAPVAFTRGQRIIGAVRSVEYAGLLRLHYAVRLSHDGDGWPSHATISIRSEHDVPGSPAFVLVNNQQRIPLSINDGQAVDVAPLSAEGRLTDSPSKELRWSAMTTHGAGELWAANLSGRQGWIRLFVNTPSAQRLRTIALLDPPVDALRLAQVSSGPPQ